MKRILWKMYDAAPAEGAGGADATAVVLKAIDGMKAGMVKKEDVEAIAGDKIKAAVEPISGEVAEIKATVNALNEKAGQINQPAAKVKGVEDQIGEALTAQVETLKALADGDRVKSVNFKLQLKDVGNMTIANNLTGSNGVPTYAPGIVGVPNSPLHLTSIIPTVSSATDLYHYIRHDETIGEGGFDYQTNESTTKSQRDYDLTDVTVELKDLAAYTKVSRKMLRNVPALQSYLGQYLPEDYYQAEDVKGMAVLTAAAGSMTTGTDGGFEGIYATIGALGDNKYTANGIVMRPSAVYRLMANTESGAGFNIPGSVMVDNFGRLRINGIPVYSAIWVPEDKAIIADWRYFKKIQSEGLSVRSTEFDQDDFVKNRITFRTEAVIGFALERPKAFSIIDLGFVS